MHDALEPYFSDILFQACLPHVDCNHAQQGATVLLAPAVFAKDTR